MVTIATLSNTFYYNFSTSPKEDNQRCQQTGGIG